MEFGNVEQYLQALQDPRQALLPTGNALLYEGRLERQLNSGDSTRLAVTFSFIQSNNERCVLRCFLDHPNADPEIGKRYQQLEAELPTILGDNAAKIKFYPRGITFQRDDGHTVTGPLVEMKWVAGESLLSNVARLCRGNDCVGLEGLSKAFCDLLNKMRTVAHGDLAANNILIRNGKLILIDYDLFFLPAFRGTHGLVGGQPGFRHPATNPQLKAPQRLPFDERVDYFPALVVLTALKALSDRPALWHTFGDDHGNMLLFTERDLGNPNDSGLFKELDRSSNPDVRNTVETLWAACVQSAELTPHPLDATLMHPQMDTNGLSARIVNSEMLVEWAWPPDVRAIWLAYAIDRRPSPPWGYETSHELVFKAGISPPTLRRETKVSHGQRLHVEIYRAIPDDDGEFVLPEHEANPFASCIARFPYQVEMRLRAGKKRRLLVVEVTSLSDVPLPALNLVERR